MTVYGNSLSVNVLSGLPPECTEGDVQTYTCPDGTIVDDFKCIGGVWVDQNPVCPVCVSGNTKTFTCTDGTIITTYTCVNDEWVPTNNVCPVLCTGGEIKCGSALGAEYADHGYMCVNNVWVDQGLSDACTTDFTTTTMLLVTAGVALAGVVAVAFGLRHR